VICEQIRVYNAAIEDLSMGNLTNRYSHSVFAGLLLVPAPIAFAAGTVTYCSSLA
jgi:hypothetical protein